MRKIIMTALAATLLCATAEASTITFSGLADPNGANFISYTEDGYTVTAKSSNIFAAQQYGEPVPDIFTEAGPATFDVISALGNFNFKSIDISSGSGSSDDHGDFTITGFLGSATVFSQMGSAFGGPGDTFINVGSVGPTSLIDRLVVMQTGSFGLSGLNFDNIAVDLPAVAGVPEPASWAMFIGGFGMIGAAMRRRKLAMSFA